MELKRLQGWSNGVGNKGDWKDLLQILVWKVRTVKIRKSCES